MRSLDPPSRRARRSALLAAALLVMGVAGPALAKLWAEARLDAPIAFGTPGGAELLVGVTVTVPEGIPLEPVAGTGIVLELVGRDGARTRASADADAAGHALIRIVVPDGGPRDLAVTLEGRPEAPIMLTESPFAFGPVSAGTAQLSGLGGSPSVVPPAPAADPAADPAAANEAADPAAGTADAGAEANGPPAWLLLAVIGAIAAVGLVLAGRIPGPWRGRAPGGAQGA